MVLATYNEEGNIGPCLESVLSIADEMIIVDGSSKDKTRDIAKQYGAHVVETENHPIFHINKQKAIELAKNEWILQLDADERVSRELASEILTVIGMNDGQIDEYQKKLPHRDLFLRHQRLLEERDGKIGLDSGPYAGFFVPRLNFFLGKFLRHGGVYPDGVIRLIKIGKARLPAKDVHEQIIVEGRVGWLQNDLLHFDSPNFKRYLKKNSRYIDLLATQLKAEKVSKSPLQFLNYYFVKPIKWFLMTQIRHKGILDGWQGVIFSFFSALRFPRSYWRYVKNDN